MSENMDSTQKRKTLGTISTSRLSKMPEWKNFTTASAAFSGVKEKLSEAKAAVKSLLRKHSKNLKDEENLDFYISGGDSIVIFKHMKQPKTRTKKQEIDFD